ncbi:MAG: hypothetical protein P0120_02920 [Nitrospira sp.]|nr:hypothetical protein [Nitrospira sp.]
MTDEDEFAKLQRKLHSQSKEAHVPKDDLAEVREIARQKVAGFSACLEKRAVAISSVNADLSPIECWREEGVGGQRRRAEMVGGARLDRVVLSYWTEFDTVPRPAFQSPRPWDLMRKGHYLHIMFFRDRKSIDDQELWFKLPLEPFESSWVMTVQHMREAVYGQTAQSESQTLHTFASDQALADFCLDRLIRIAY